MNHEIRFTTSADRILYRVRCAGVLQVLFASLPSQAATYRCTIYTDSSKNRFKCLAAYKALNIAFFECIERPRGKYAFTHTVEKSKTRQSRVQ